MNRHLVVDASIAVKWILPESDSDIAAAILDRDATTFHAPELCVAEVTNVLWKRVKRGELSRSEALEALDLISALPVQHHSHTPLIASALMIAMQYDITVYDALYVALARMLGTTLITADRKLVKAGAKDPDWPARSLDTSPA